MMYANNNACQCHIFNNIGGEEQCLNNLCSNGTVSDHLLHTCQRELCRLENVYLKETTEALGNDFNPLEQD